MGRLKGSVPLQWFKLLLWGISSSFPFDLPGPKPIFAASQTSPMCVHASLSRNRDCHRALLGSLPFDFQGAYCACHHGGLLISRMRNMWFGQEPSSTLNCPAALILEFLSMANGSPVTLLGLEVRGHLPPASVFAGYAVAPSKGPVLVSDNDVHLGEMCMRKNHLISRKEHTYIRLVQQET